MRQITCRPMTLNLPLTDNLPPYDCPPEEVVPSIRMSNLCHASICAFVPISFVPMEQLEPYGRVKSISAFGNDDTFR
eukprot:scaffold6480_cov27-Tisochrysis_lutea.AAC.1